MSKLLLDITLMSNEELHSELALCNQQPIAWLRYNNAVSWQEYTEMLLEELSFRTIVGHHSVESCETCSLELAMLESEALR